MRIGKERFPIVLWLSGVLLGYALHDIHDYFVWQRPLDTCMEARKPVCYVGGKTVFVKYKN